MEVFTVGHSTRSHEAFVELLQAHRIERVMDIRRIPYSRYNPQFNREEIDRTMPPSGILYEHLEELGGRRPSQEVLERARSCSERSHGFADYMHTPQFRHGLDRVIALAAAERIALMCAESDPSHCHRFWVADALVAKGITVRHIMSVDVAELHPENLFTFEA